MQYKITLTLTSKMTRTAEHKKKLSETGYIFISETNLEGQSPKYNPFRYLLKQTAGALQVGRKKQHVQLGGAASGTYLGLNQ